jgi:hypothetical protein
MAIYRYNENEDKEEIKGELKEPPPLFANIIKTLIAL